MSICYHQIEKTFFYICLLLRQKLSKSHIILITFIQTKKTDKQKLTIGSYKATCESIYKLQAYFSIRWLTSIFNFLNICYYMPKNKLTNEKKKYFVSKQWWFNSKETIWLFFYKFNLKRFIGHVSKIYNIQCT